jgi:putative transposase
MYYGPEFISRFFKKWAHDKGILLLHIQPGKPAQNGYIERFNRTYREEVLDMNWFGTLEEVRTITQKWMLVYNSQRPHESLAGLSPEAFAQWRTEMTVKFEKENSTLN